MWISIYKKIPKRLGIDAQTLKYLDLSANDLSENALDKKGQPSTDWLGLYNTLMRKRKRDFDDEWTIDQHEFYYRYLTEKHKELGKGPDGKGISYIGYLKSKRIELDTVVNEVGAARFWEWLEDRILKTFETRDYNRAIIIPSYIPTPTLEEFQKRVQALLKTTSEDRRKAIIEELRDVKELLDTDDKLKDIKADLLNNHILKNAKIKRIDKALQKIIDQLPPVDDNKNQKI